MKTWESKLAGGMMSLFFVLIIGFVLLWPVGCKLVEAEPVDRITSFTWTAVDAVEYEIGYSTSMITIGNWFTCPKISNIPATVPVGDAESFSVTLQLEPDTWYYFTARGFNRIGAIGLFGNVDSIWTDPVDVPPAITDLDVE